MRDLIALAVIGLGSTLVLVALRAMTPRRPGRHSADFLAEPPTPEPATPVDPWSRPWSTPTPEHVEARHTPQRGEDVGLVRPYVLADDTLNLGIICERRRAAVLATLGVDWPYGYVGDQFETLAARTAGVTA